jgi:hypothetical protein
MVIYSEQASPSARRKNDAAKSGFRRVPVERFGRPEPPRLADHCVVSAVCQRASGPFAAERGAEGAPVRRVTGDVLDLHRRHRTGALATSTAAAICGRRRPRTSRRAYTSSTATSRQTTELGLKDVGYRLGKSREWDGQLLLRRSTQGPSSRAGGVCSIMLDGICPRTTATRSRARSSSAIRSKRGAGGWTDREPTRRSNSS